MPCNVTYTCANCGYTTLCEDQREVRRIKEAAKINGTGPFCDLCRHVDMAARYAEIRGFDAVADQLRRIYVSIHQGPVA